MSCVSCCCLKIEESETADEWMLRPNTLEPSLFQRLCLCQCSEEERRPSGILLVPEISGLAGVTLQLGDHATAGSLQTLKWTTYDQTKRTATMQVFGGFGGAAGTGQWTEPPNSLHWMFLMNLGRCGNYTYRFTFSEDFRYSDIDIQCNPLPLCCICIPCIPAWCTVPRCCVSYDMRQTSDSKDGSTWDRYSSKCGGEKEFTYKLVQVFTENGDEGEQFKELATAPKQVMITL